jgi:hypothetical protein
VRTTQDTVGAITTAVGVGGSAVIRTVAQTVGSISEAVVTGARLVGGNPPIIRGAFRVIARGIGHTTKPVGTGSHTKPEDE